MEIPDSVISGLVIALIALVLGELIHSHQARYKFKDEMKEYVDKKISAFDPKINDCHTKIESCNTEIGNLNFRTGNFESTHKQCYQDIWNKADKVEKKFDGKYDKLREEIITVKTIAQYLEQVGDKATETAYTDRRE